MANKKPKKPLDIETITHNKAKRKNLPTVEHQSVMPAEEVSPVHVAYLRRNRALDPQLIWRNLGFAGNATFAHAIQGRTQMS